MPDSHLSHKYSHFSRNSNCFAKNTKYESCLENVESDIINPDRFRFLSQNSLSRKNLKFRDKVSKIRVCGKDAVSLIIRAGFDKYKNILILLKLIKWNGVELIKCNGVEFLPQTLIFKSQHLCNPMS